MLNAVSSWPPTCTTSPAPPTARSPFWNGRETRYPAASSGPRLWFGLPTCRTTPQSTGPLYREALAEAAGDDALTATIHTSLALSMAWSEGAEQGLAHAREAVPSASRTGDPEIECRALAAYGDWNFRAGRGMQQAEMDRAMTLERSLPSWPLDRGPTDLFSRQLVLVADLGGCARAAARALRRAHDAGQRRRRLDRHVVAEPPRVAGRQLGGGRAICGRLVRRQDAARTGHARRRVSRRAHRGAPRPGRRSARRSRARPGGRGGDGHSHLGVGLRLDPRLPRALARRPERGALAARTLVRAAL